jgi:hypothetical protein
MLLCKAMISTEGMMKENRVFESMVTLLQSYVSKNVGSGRVCMYVTWDPNTLLAGVDNLYMISDTEQLSNACLGCHVWKCQNTWPINNTGHSNHVFMCDPVAECWNQSLHKMTFEVQLQNHSVCLCFDISVLLVEYSWMAARCSKSHILCTHGSLVY